MVKIFKKYKEFILYILFGIMTTAVNIIVYYACTRLLSLTTVESTIIAWILSVLFAYVTNRIYVFKSNKNSVYDIFQEIVTFVGCRLLSGVIDTVIMFVFVDVMDINDMIIKILSNIVVIILNYIASKLIIFKK